MSKLSLSVFVVAASLLLPSMVANAAAADGLKPQAVIFEGKHLEKTKAGDELVYNFSRKVSDEKVAGEAFTDKITVKIGTVTGEKRAAEMQIYSGDRARELQVLPELTINPVFVVTMQQAVATFRAATNGDFNYLKVRFSKELDAKGNFEPCKIDYKGQIVDAYRINNFVAYKDDPASEKMRGYNTTSNFSMIVSPEVPGHLVETVSVIKSVTEGSASFEDRTAIEGFGGVK